MKTALFTTITVIGILAAGCSRESYTESGTSEPGSLKITIKNAAGAEVGRAIGTPDQEDENTIHSFGVFVFNYASSELEKFEVFYNTLTGVVTGLSAASTKRIVVFANYDFSGFEDVPNYYQLWLETITLETQNPGDFSSSGLFMSGELDDPVTLSTTQQVAVEVPIRRVAAKVRLGELRVIPNPEYSLDHFTLVGVSMQKVPYRAYALTDGIYTAQINEYGGGLPGTTTSLVYEFLREQIALPAGYISGNPVTTNAYFYVLPNAAPFNEATLMTLFGTYTVGRMHYTFPINDLVIPGEDQSGTYIKRNMVYTLNITLRRLGLGATDPDAVDTPADLEVTVDVQDWAGELVHNLEW